MAMFLFVQRRFHKGKLVQDDSRHKTSIEIDQKLYHIARLEILNVQIIDGGEYKAVAKNKHGEGTATINLNFANDESGKPK